MALINRELQHASLENLQLNKIMQSSFLTLEMSSHSNLKITYTTEAQIILGQYITNFYCQDVACFSPDREAAIIKNGLDYTFTLLTVKDGKVCVYDIIALKEMDVKEGVGRCFPWISRSGKAGRFSKPVFHETTAIMYFKKLDDKLNPTYYRFTLELQPEYASGEIEPITGPVMQTKSTYFFWG